MSKTPTDGDARRRIRNLLRYRRALKRVLFRTREVEPTRPATQLSPSNSPGSPGDAQPLKTTQTIAATRTRRAERAGRTPRLWEVCGYPPETRDVCSPDIVSSVTTRRVYDDTHASAAPTRTSARRENRARNACHAGPRARAHTFAARASDHPPTRQGGSGKAVGRPSRGPRERCASHEARGSGSALTALYRCHSPGTPLS